MAPIDIELPAALRDALAVPRCADLGLPAPTTLTLSLPTGGSLPAINDFTRGLPTDCSLAFNLLAQIGPLMGNLHCVISILKVVKPMMEVVTGLTKNPLKPPAQAVAEMAEAIPPAMECILKLVVPQSGLVFFLADVLNLIAKLLKCLMQHLESLASMLGGLNLKIESAAGNPDLLGSLQCAQENALTSAAGLMASVEPLAALIELAKPLASFAGVELDIDLSGLGSADSAEAIQQVVETLTPIVAAIETVAQALGGG